MPDPTIPDPKMPDLKIPVPKHYSTPPIPDATPPTERVLKHLLEIEPDSADIHAALGTVYLRDEEFQSAVESLKVALKLNPELSKMRTNLGISLLMLEEESEAEVQFREALIHDPSLEIATLQLVELLFKRGEYESSLKMIERALLNKSTTELNVQAGVCSSALEQTEKAKSYFDKAVKDAHPVALTWLAEFECKQGKELILSEKLIEGVEVLSNAYNRSPMVFTSDTKTVALLAEITKIDTSRFLKLESASYVALIKKLLRLGVIWEVFAKEQELEQGIETWEAGIRKRGSYPYGQYRLGIIQAFQGKFMESLDSLDICRAQLPVKKAQILKLAEVVDAISEVRDDV